MKPETLQHFSRQLHSWCTERLNQKPGPFRQAESHPHLLGRNESLSPPVVLWVNRESCLAGGVILLPNKEEEDIFRSGRETARALGLPHYHTWGRHEVSCWSVLHDPPEKIWHYDLPAQDSAAPANFRKSLNLLVDHMEQAFFTNQLQIPEISELYLGNLIHTTLIDLLPEIQRSLTVDRSRDVRRDSLAPTEAGNRLLQKLIPPLGLSLTGSDYTSTPATISTSIAAAVSKLPENLVRAWSESTTAPLFPKEANRRFHHYCCRVRQLTPLTKDTVVHAVERILEQWALQLGGFPVQEVATPLKRVVINAAGLDQANRPVMEIAPPGILAATALIGHFENPEKAEPAEQFTTVFSLTSELSQHQVTGTLYETAVPAATEQKELNAFLRISWPNRKLTVAGKSPAWVWQFLHLAGLTGKKSQLDLIMPADWLWKGFGEIIMPLLSGRLCFAGINMIHENQLHCRLKSAFAEDAVTTVTRAAGPERILSGGQPEQLRARILLALHLPDAIYQLLDEKTLEMHTAEEFDEFPKAGLEYFIRSSIGQGLWQIIAPDRTRPRGDKLSAELARAGLPTPGKKTLLALARLARPENQTSTADIDQELSVWLGDHLPPLPTAAPGRSSRRPMAASPEKADQVEIFHRRCQAEEIPVFPDNYLYDTPFKERVRFAFSGPLKIVETFFDQVILTDRQNRITVDGTRQAEALVLISAFRSGSVELPQSSAVMAEILDRYYRDLEKLRMAFCRHAAEINDGEGIAAAVDSIWARLQLPQWPLSSGR